MTRKQKTFLAIALALAVLGVGGAILVRTIRIVAPRPAPPVTLEGSVLKQDADPEKQTPLADVTVTARAGASVAVTKSDPSGLFRVTLNPGTKKGETATLTFEHPDYKPLIITAVSPGDQLYIARLESKQLELETASNRVQAPAKIVAIRNVRVRYSFKDRSTIGVGSLAKQFAAPNTANVPCRGKELCSPDRKWKATRTDLPLDAEDGNEFQNVRVSCIAGPCAFTRVEPGNFTRPARKITISVLNWSATANFLVEADVTRTMVRDIVRQSYPYTLDQTMNFALPASSEGPSVEAELDAQHIVFPLGPALILSWATCSVEVSPDGNKIYRCQLKPGYKFAE